ncbi:MAG: hypothetical protein KDH96_05815 [Candidatus Riesia sp.]|nr:hypothetical protein [Candidatus Riesia sp.]
MQQQTAITFRVSHEDYELWARLKSVNYKYSQPFCFLHGLKALAKEHGVSLNDGVRDKFGSAEINKLLEG